MPDNNIESKYQAAMKFINFVRGYVEAMVITAKCDGSEESWHRLSQELDTFFTDSYSIPKMSSKKYREFIREMNHL